jgi:hypothetical protein
VLFGPLGPPLEDLLMDRSRSRRTFFMVGDRPVNPTLATAVLWAVWVRFASETDGKGTCYDRLAGAMRANDEQKDFHEWTMHGVCQGQAEWTWRVVSLYRAHKGWCHHARAAGS